MFRPMFRQPPLPCAYLTAALGLAVFVAPAPAWSQDRSTYERLDRLERDLNMLQRQVYRGGPPPVIAPGMGGDGGAAVNTEIRMDRLEGQMRDLTGRVEEFINEIAQIRQRVEQINADVDMRLGQAGAGPDVTASAKAAPVRPGSAAAARSARQFPPQVPPAPPEADDEPLNLPRRPMGAGPAALMPPGTAVPPPSGSIPGGPIPGGPTPIYGTLTPPGTPQDRPLPRPSRRAPRLPGVLRPADRCRAARRPSSTTMPSVS